MTSTRKRRSEENDNPKWVAHQGDYYMNTVYTVNPGSGDHTFCNPAVQGIGAASGASRVNGFRCNPDHMFEGIDDKSKPGHVHNSTGVDPAVAKATHDRPAKEMSMANRTLFCPHRWNGASMRTNQQRTGENSRQLAIDKFNHDNDRLDELFGD